MGSKEDHPVVVITGKLTRAIEALGSRSKSCLWKSCRFRLRNARSKSGSEWPLSRITHSEFTVISANRFLAY